MAQSIDATTLFVGEHKDLEIVAGIARYGGEGYVVLGPWACVGVNLQKKQFDGTRRQEMPLIPRLPAYNLKKEDEEKTGFDLAFSRSAKSDRATIFPYQQFSWAQGYDLTSEDAWIIERLSPELRSALGLEGKMGEDA